jgi:IS1 family transposase
MNRISAEQRRAIVACLVEGNSLRATERMTGASRNTITKLLVDLGTVCSIHMDREMRDLPCERLQVDEIWSFCGMKQKNVPVEKRGELGYGDVWTWVAIDADTKLVPTYRVGSRDYPEAVGFLQDLAKRLSSRVQLTSDAHRPYLTAVKHVFGGEIDYAQLQKIYGLDPKVRDTRYSPAVCTGVKVKVVSGDPDPDHINTSYVERQNLTMRMGMRRFTRLTNAFSKKVENLAAAVSLHFMHYNYCRPHQTLTKETGTPTTPAMAAGISDHVWTLDELIALLAAAESTPIKRGPYKPRAAKISN